MRRPRTSKLTTLLPIVSDLLFKIGPDQTFDACENIVMFHKVLYERDRDQFLDVFISRPHTLVKKTKNPFNWRCRSRFAQTYLLHDVTCNITQKDVWQEFVIVVNMLVVRRSKFWNPLKK